MAAVSRAPGSVYPGLGSARPDVHRCPALSLPCPHRHASTRLALHPRIVASRRARCRFAASRDEGSSPVGSLFFGHPGSGTRDIVPAARRLKARSAPRQAQVLAGSFDGEPREESFVDLAGGPRGSSASETRDESILKKGPMVAGSFFEAKRRGPAAQTTFREPETAAEGSTDVSLDLPKESNRTLTQPAATQSVAADPPVGEGEGGSRRLGDGEGGGVGPQGAVAAPPPLTSSLDWSLGRLDLALQREDLSSVLAAVEGAAMAPVVDAVEESGALGPGVFQRRAARILDLALGESDLAVVGRAYRWLEGVGVLRSFGREKETLLTSEPRLVTPDVLRMRSGLEASKLSPRKWGSSNSLAPLAAIGLFSLLVNNGVDVRPLALVVLVLGLVDSVFLGGAGQAQLLSLWPPFRRRVLVHEAGHVLVAYLLGCPVRGVILDPFTALDLGIQGQAGTQFWDYTLDLEMKEGKLTGASVDRYSAVLFAGVAAEALVCGEAEGGESDENLFKALVGSLQPQWSSAKVSNQARWAVLQAYTILRRNRRALDAVVQSLEEGAQMGDIVLAIETSV